MIPTWIDGQWEILLPPHRAARPEWPWWEAARLAAMWHHCGPNDLIVDVGAEEGDLSCLYASWGCDVVLVEPNPKAWPCIRATFEANGLTERVRGWYLGLLSDTTKDADEAHRNMRAGSEHWPTVSECTMVPDHGFHHLAEHSGIDPVTTVDDLCETLGIAPTVLTLDVEGGELHVLRGAAKTLAEFKPKLFVSVHPEFMRDLYQQDDAELHGYLERAGYESTYLATDHEEHWMFLPRR